MSQIFLGRDTKQQGLALGKLLGEGASGKVYAVPGMAGFAAKLYHDERECRKHESKIDLMLGNPPDLPALAHGNHAYPQIAWPEAKLYDRAGRFIGFLMPEIDFARSTSLVNLLQKNSRRAEKISEYYGYRVLVARNLASIFVELHRAGHHMIDMKPANLRFYPSVSWMAVVDVDGFSIEGAARRVAAEQVSDEYIAPESWRKQPAELGVEQDLFALAVIIFQLLDNGVHPFAGSAARGSNQATDLQARIQEGLYPYGLLGDAALNPSTASIHRSFRRTTRLLFDRAFVPGRPRPTAHEWREHLDELVDTLVPCAAKPNEHAHFGSGCGFCGHDARVQAAARVAKPRPRPRPQNPQRFAGATSNVVRLPVPARGAPPHQGRPPLQPRPPVRTFHMPRPAFKWWQNWPLLLLLGLLLFSSDAVWRRLSPTAAAGLRAAGMLTMLSPPTQAAVPPPEDRGAIIDNAVIGSAPDSMAGCAGGRGDVASDGCSDLRDTPLHRAMATRYRDLLVQADGYDRALLIEEHGDWMDQRTSCAQLESAAACQAEVDRRRYDRLLHWKEIAAQIARTSAETDPPPTIASPPAGR